MFYLKKKGNKTVYDLFWIIHGPHCVDSAMFLGSTKAVKAACSYTYWPEMTILCEFLCLLFIAAL